MKLCKKCGVEKAESEFHVGGSSCKPCKRAYDIAYCAARFDYYMERNKRARDVAKKQAASARAKLRYPEKTAARAAVYSALVARKIERQPCEVCGETKTEAHHDDYSKPLDVRWLCGPHHREHHRNENAARRAA